MVSAFAYPGVQIVHPRLFADRAGRRLLHQPDVGPRHRQGPAVTASAGRRVDACRHARRRATRRKPISGQAGVKHASGIFTIAAPARRSRETLARGLIARTERGSARAVRSSPSICPPGARRAVSAKPSPACWAARRCCRNSAPWATATKTSCCSTLVQRRAGVAARDHAHPPPVAAGARWSGTGTTDARRRAELRPGRGAGRQPGQGDGRGRDARAPILPGSRTWRRWRWPSIGKMSRASWT